MHCEQLKDLIPLYALGALDPAEEQAVRAHLSGGCPLCEGRLAEAHTLLAMIPLSLSPVAAPASAKGTLMKRVAAKGTPVSGKLPALEGGGWKIGPAMMGLAAGALIAAVGLWYVVGTYRRSEDALRAQLAIKDAQVTQMTSTVDAFQTEIDLIKAPGLQVVRLEGQAAQPGAVAHLFIDSANHKIMFCGVNLKALTPNKTYELWLVSGDKKIPAGLFTADEHGESMYVQKMPPNLGPLAMVAVTDEPTGGVPQPTGSFQLLGKL